MLATKPTTTSTLSSKFTHTQPLPRPVALRMWQGKRAAGFLQG